MLCNNVLICIYTAQFLHFINILGVSDAEKIISYKNKSSLKILANKKNFVYMDCFIPMIITIPLFRR
jgi:hypothetical protein